MSYKSIINKLEKDNRTSQHKRVITQIQLQSPESNELLDVIEVHKKENKKLQRVKVINTQLNESSDVVWL